ncbi:MAG: hypothetical protein ACFB15_09985 [Cyclobacteriaceae bacterium]
MIRVFLVIQAVLIVSLSPAQNITIDTILHRHFQAVGGLEQWQQIKTCYAEQSYWMIPVYMPPHKQFLGDQLPKNQKSYYQYPDQYRIAIYREGEPSTATIVTQGETKFYSYRAKQETILPDPKYTKAVQEETFSSIVLGTIPLLLSAYQDSAIAYQGVMKAYDRSCHKLVIAHGLPKGGRAFVYLDTETHLVHAFVYANHTDLYKIYDEYREVDGLLIPHHIDYYQEDELVGEYTIDKIEINRPIDPVAFTVW